MKVSKSWLKELVDLKVSMKEVEKLLPLRTIATKEISDDFIELDMKGYNRADLLSMRGVAFEVAAITNSKLNFNQSEDYAWEGRDLPTTPVNIEDQKLCQIQAVAKIEGLRIEKSPPQWVKKLADSGMRSIDIVTDITNLVMLEYGHPLHAFDGKAVSGDTINVRRAKSNEEIVTLDGKKRLLSPEDIVLADDKNALDVAGVMGGKDTEIIPATTSILLSASMFNPIMIRKTSGRLGLSSEASKRFYHGLTVKRFNQALDHAIRMYQQIGGTLTAFTVIGEASDKSKMISLSQTKINSLIGVDISPHDVESYLERLGFSLKASEGGWEVTAPYWRLDIDIEEDLIEEVARMYGYEKLPAKELTNNEPEKTDQKIFDLIRDFKENLTNLGLIEVQTYPYFSTAILENLNWDKNNLIKVANPISSETEYLRRDIWPNLLETAAKNLKQGLEEIAIFEIGKVYYPSENQPPKEGFRLALLLTGDDSVQELYSIFKEVITKLAILITLGSNQKGEYEEWYFHPNRFSFLDNANQEIGGVAEVHPRLTYPFGIKERVAVIEIDLEPLV